MVIIYCFLDFCSTWLCHPWGLTHWMPPGWAGCHRWLHGLTILRLGVTIQQASPGWNSLPHSGGVDKRKAKAWGCRGEHWDKRRPAVLGRSCPQGFLLTEAAHSGGRASGSWDFHTRGAAPALGLLKFPHALQRVRCTSGMGWFLINNSPTTGGGHPATKMGLACCGSFSIAVGRGPSHRAMNWSPQGGQDAGVSSVTQAKMKK